MPQLSNDSIDIILRSAIENLSEAAVIVNDASRPLWTNKAFLRLFSQAETMPATLEGWGLDAKVLQRARPALEREGVWRGELDVSTADAGEVALLASISRVSDVVLEESPAAWLILLTDITRQRQYMRHLETLIQRDSLTGLLNREGFRDRVLNGLFRCRAAGQHLAVLFLDLDGFKVVNDQYGHEVGDQVLVQVGERLGNLARGFRSGVDVARLGGDEFALLVAASDDTIAEAEEIASEILRVLLLPFAPPVGSQLISASIGGRVGPFGDESASDLLHAADLAMYEVKRRSKRNFLIDTGEPGREETMGLLKIELEHPYQRQKLAVHLQPIVDLNTGEITVVEARVRFKEGAGRQFTASDVLRAINSADSHLALDQTVLERAIDVLERLDQRNFRHFPVAVNLSVGTCIQKATIDKLLVFLDRSDIPPERLRLELPMEAFLISPARMIDLVQRVSNLRYEIMIDHVDTLDFSRARLDQMSLRGIKLHESLVEGAPGDKASEERIESICSAALQNGLIVGVEGIVRLEQLRFLRGVGCTEGQGDLVSKPRDLPDLEFLLRRGRCW